ncbi:pentatricopeptide repeat-containing protein At2g13600 [Cryptomeria japonica]|uniref:pentatricopeptide repeat-containing protein At2g13600 n=1 Tax=Cryptomeria japonica TaxID=3369 RepID=UPI0027D9E275|nr:pentatricopeptide repeat-containing protein At2g13600 [Cryptomeria japonica]
MPPPSTAHANLTALCRKAQLKEALHILLTTHKPPEDSSTYLQLLQTCIVKNALLQGKIIHTFIAQRRFAFARRTSFRNKFLNMYVKCGSLVDARKVFDQMEERDSVSWNVMIAVYRRHGYPQEALRLFHQMQRTGYAQNGFTEKALQVYKQMQVVGVKPNSSTFASILPACAQIGALELGTVVHQNIIKSGVCLDVIVGSALVDMYAKCGSMHKAFELFDEMPQRNEVSWTVMIAGYAQNGFVQKALETFKQMQLAGVKPDSTTFSSLLPACTKIGALDQGMKLHQDIIERGLSSDIAVGNALIDMYAKCGRIHKSCEIFDKILRRDVISWNSMIAGYAQYGFVEKAIETFNQMLLADIMPDLTTFASILPACAKMEALELGMNLHQSIIKSGFLSDVVTANTLIDMYAKCGSILKAREVFNRLAQRDAISWNAMVAGYAQNGFFEKALETFKEMSLADAKPDFTTFASILPACSKVGALKQSMEIHQFIIKSGFSSDVVVTNALIDVHAGLVDEGCKYFKSMSESYCIMPKTNHYVCMVDVLSRAGYLEETLKFIIKMPIKPVMVVWTCFLSVCRLHKNIELGVFTASLLLELDPKNATTYVLLSNFYAEMGRWEEVHMVRRLMNDRGIKKVPGSSWIAGHKVVHAYCGD